MNQKAFIGKNAVENWLHEIQANAPKRCFLVRGHRSFDVCGGRAIIDRTLA